MKVRLRILSLLCLGIFILGISNAQAEDFWVENFVNFDENDYYLDGDGYWDSDHSFFVLTEARGNQRMRIFDLDQRDMTVFSAQFDIRIGGGSGADGLVFAWVSDYQFSGGTGGRHDFVNADGYGVEFDCYFNNEYNDPNAQHISLVNGDVSTHLAAWETDEGVLEDDEWHTVIVNNDNGAVDVYWDGQLVIQHQIQDYQGFQGYFGFTATTGGQTNWHCIDNMSINDAGAGDPDVEIALTAPNGDEVFTGGEVEAITWDVVGDPDSVVVSYSLDNGETWVQIGVVDDGSGTIDWTIPQEYSHLTLVKVEAYVDGEIDASDVSDGSFIMAPTMVHQIFYPGWHLISIPLNPVDGTPEAVLGDDIEGQWNLYDFDYNVGFGHPEEMTTGPGYWFVVTHDTVDLDVEGATNVEPVTVDLDLAWNIIGDPFPIDVSLEDLVVRFEDLEYTVDEAADENILSPVVYGYTLEEGYYESQTIEPWHGYWMLALQEGVEIDLFPGDGRPVRDSGTEDLWEVTPIVEFGIGADSFTFGARRGATNDFDARYDFAEAPGAPEQNHPVRAYFSHDNWLPDLADQFNRDIHSQVDNRMDEWHFVVNTTEAGEATIRWDGIEEQLPEGYEAHLQSPFEDGETDMLVDDHYTFQSEGGETEFIIRVVGTPLDVSDNQQSLPTQVDLIDVHPNPFNSMTTISFTIPTSSHSSLNVYDLSGKKVANLMSGNLTSGQYTEVWNAEGNPAGVYFVRLTSAGVSATRKIVLTK